MNYGNESTCLLSIYQLYLHSKFNNLLVIFSW